MPDDSSNLISLESHDFSSIYRCVNFAIAAALLAMGTGIAQADSADLRVVLFIGLFLVLGVLVFMVTTPLKVMRKKESERKEYLEGITQEKRKLVNKIEDLSATQTDLNNANTNLQQAFQSIQQHGDEAKARATELESLTDSLNHMTEESDTIFNSVDHGLCLIDSSYKIGQRVSLMMYEIFETENLKGLSFLDLMRPLIPEKELKTLDNFLGLQFKKKTLPSQLEKFNPLKQVEITLNWDGERFVNKHLSFKFQRIMDGEDIAAILITVSDVSAAVALETELEHSREEQDRRTEIMLEIVQSDPAKLQVFLQEAENTLESINLTLKDHGVHEGSENAGIPNKDLVEEVYREVHTVKGNASLLGLESIVQLTHSLESKLDELKMKEEIKGDEYLGALVHLASLRKQLVEYREISDTVREGFVGVSSEQLDSDCALSGELADFVEKTGSELGKKVFLRSQFEIENLSETGIKNVKNIFIQAARNSLTHGIEMAEERAKKGKLEEGELVLICKPASQQKNLLSEPAYELTFRDDGAGLDLTMIRDRAVALGLMSQGEADAAHPAMLANLIFHSGFSTMSEANKISGRGVGMDVIKEIVVTELRGKLSVSFARGSYFQVSCFVPSRLLVNEKCEALTA